VPNLEALTEVMPDIVMGARIAIVYPCPYLDTVPSLCNTALLLSQQGYFVDIFTHASPEFKTPIFDNERIAIKVLRSHASPRRKVSPHRVLRRFRGLKAFFAFLRDCYRVTLRGIDELSSFAKALRCAIQVWRFHRLSPYRCFIGVDAEGLSLAHAVTRFIRVPLAYYSLELLLSNEVHDRKQARIKQQEVVLSRKSAFVIIQDQERARLLAKDNQISLEKFVLVPNAPLGPTQRASASYWHRHLGLLSGVRIVLYAGSLWRWTAIDKIADSTKSWPENWVLVVHARYDADSSKDIEKLRELAASRRVFLSLKPVARQEYDALVNGANIGIAFYVPIAGSTTTQRNIQAVGLSSGKIAYYLRAGLPVIVNQGTSISELVQGERCGVSVQDPRDIGNAIVQIAQDYQSYSQRAYETFDRYFNFAHTFEEVVRRIDSLDQ